jgi:hypothetical protein
VQGFSGTHALADGSFLVLSDNGFGSKANSADFLLALHRITPRTDDGTGETTYDGTVLTFSDPDRLIPGRRGATEGARQRRRCRPVTRARRPTGG